MHYGLRFSELARSAEVMHPDKTSDPRAITSMNPLYYGGEPPKTRRSPPVIHLMGEESAHHRSQVVPEASENDAGPVSGSL